MKNQSNAITLLRIGLAFVFAYAAVAMVLHPNDWIGFVPTWVQTVMSEELAFRIHGLVDLVLALWLLSGFKTFYAAVLTSLNLVSIIVFNLGAFDIVFRDVGLLTAAVALALLSYENYRS